MYRQDQRGAVASWGLLELDYYQRRIFSTLTSPCPTRLGKKGNTGAEADEESKSRVGVNLSTLAKLAKKSTTYVSEQIRTSNEAEVEETGLVMSNVHKEVEREVEGRVAVCLVFYPQELQTDPGSLLLLLAKATI